MIHKIDEVSNLAKRLLGAMIYGFRIEQYAGHRYIMIDLEADYLPLSIDLSNQYNASKIYGSVTQALNKIDGWLQQINKPSLIEACELTYNLNEDSEFEIIIEPTGKTV